MVELPFVGESIFKFSSYICLFTNYRFISRNYVYFVTRPFFTVRLVNGSTLYEGRVEVYHNGEWGTVCDNGWNLNDAQVVCSELNFGNAIAAQHRAFFGESSGEIWLDNLNCNGTELTIGECSHRGWGVEYCNHYEDASVKCSAGNISA